MRLAFSNYSSVAGGRRAGSSPARFHLIAKGDDGEVRPKIAALIWLGATDLKNMTSIAPNRGQDHLHVKWCTDVTRKMSYWAAITPLFCRNLADGMFPKSTGFILNVHLGENPQKTFGKGRTLHKPSVTLK